MSSPSPETTESGLAHVRVLLVDDDPLICSGLEAILAAASDLAVVGSVNDGDEVIDAVARHRPDVILMDLRMRRMDGIAATAAVVALPRPPRVLVLTTWDADQSVLRALEAGASGYLLKETAPIQIIEAVRTVARGGGVLSPRSASQVIGHVAGSNTTQRRHEARRDVEALTAREIEVAVAAARGGSNAAIAAELFVSEATVKSHLARAQDKLGCRNRVELAVIVERAGLLEAR